jgi:four helix bundle protein
MLNLEFRTDNGEGHSPECRAGVGFGSHAAMDLPTLNARSKPRDLCDRTFLFACGIVALCLRLSQQPGACRQIAGQLLRAGTPVGANAEEAKAAYSRREFACKNNIVLREARESRYWLRLIEFNTLMPAETIEPLLHEAGELIAIYTATVKRSKLPLSKGTPTF